ncbi:DNA polymerase IV [Butyrivibrio sp. INlla16]|uniref:DNA polymerase Y family protein n=1 Tax=Butyrivibrio sp. INlla16 TaxID=1520807 RepID=UPI0008844023|nr:DNA polymerase IV [Butyrivibrio sp. INlla16]SDB50591.1 DNA polymerase-4 [Butyrivibrio sp. INlla16]
MNRTIFHIDVNSAFLSWSAVKQLKENPDAVDLRTIPSVVGGDIKTRHGIVTAKSIPAKKYGINTAEPITSALQKCPNLVVVKGDFQTYREYSRAFIGILRSYSELLEQVSIDEAYLDVTDLNCESPVALAGWIRDEIRTELGFTVNVGISTNKLLAKMASDFTKPDRTHTLYPHEVKDKMWPLDIGDLYGCGKKSAEKLRSIGIRTIGDAATMDEMLLKSQLGDKFGEYIHNAANGLGSDVVHPEHEDAKSYSNETTMANDITSASYDNDMPPVVMRLSEKVSGRLKKDGVFGGTVTAQVKTSDFKRFSRQMKLSESTDNADVIYENAMILLGKLLTGEDGLFNYDIGIRLVGVGVDNLDNGEYRQGNLFDWMTTGKQEIREEKRREEKREKLEEMERLIKGKFGDGAIKKGN